MASAGTAEAPPPIGWSLPARLGLLALPAALTLFVLLANVVWTIKAVLAVVLGVTLASPAAGLLLVAAVTPLGQLIAPVAAHPDFRITEAIVVAFLAGWLARGLPDRRGPRVPGATAAALFATAVVASIAGLAWQLSAVPEELPNELNRLFHIYYSVADRLGVMDGARLVEGVGLVAATIFLVRRTPTLAVRIPEAMTVSAAAAAASSVIRWLSVGGYRVSGHLGDINAAGSYFAMALCLALGMTVRAGRRAGVIWLLLSIAIGIGLWFSESRTALAAAGIVIPAAATWYAVAGRPPRVRAAAIGIVLACGIAVFAFRVHQVSFGADYRRQFNETSLRMMAARPLFGLGIGRYYPSSTLFLSPELAWNYGLENAHNNFLQIGAELGVVGLGLFLIWLGCALARTARALAIAPRDARLLGVAAGTTAFVATWVGGHPLLIDEVAFPFWIQFGLMTALAGSAILNDLPDTPAPHLRNRGRWFAAAGAVAILIATVAIAAHPLTPPVSRDVDGFYGWETGSDGVRFRWSEKFASLFVPGNVTRVNIPMKVPAELRLRPPLEVDVVVGGAFQNRIPILGSWTDVIVTMPPGLPSSLRRIDLRVARPWQPAIYIAGSADMRTVGVQVGEPRFVR